MRNIIFFTKIITSLLFLQNISSCSNTTPRQKTPLRCALSEKYFEEPSFEGPSLFQDPIIRQVDELLKDKCTEKVTEQVLEIIEPRIKIKSCQECRDQKLTIPQEFALDALLEHILRRCDDLIRTPHYNLLQTSTNSDTIENFIILKNFQNFEPKSTKLLFLKYYKYLSKAQDKFFILPNNFDGKKYRDTTEFDCFFESSHQTFDDSELTEIKKPFLLHLNVTIQRLAALADKLESEQLIEQRSPKRQRSE